MKLKGDKVMLNRVALQSIVFTNACQLSLILYFLLEDIY